MNTKNLKQVVKFDASPSQIYQIITDSKLHSELTGGEAKIDARPGGQCTFWGGEICGEILELIPNQKIVMTWKYDSADWPEDHFSKVVYVLKPDQAGTVLEFDHLLIPETEYLDIEKGWNEYYWEPLKKK